MSFRRFAIGVGIGLVAGILLSNRTTNERVAPEKALKHIKQKLSSKYNITGSWIHMIPETFEKNNVEYKVYRGGITTTDNDEIFQYDFILDANTGTLLELIK